MIIRKLFKAEMAHAVPGAYTRRCHYLHGHSYRFELFLKSDRPNTAMMVADFKEVKDIGINDFFDSFDHTVMLWEKDPIAKRIQLINPSRYVLAPFVPTAEMMAKAFFLVTRKIIENAKFKLVGSDARVERVVVHETDTGWACFGENDLAEDRFPDIGFNQWKFSDGIKQGWKNKDWARKIRFL